MSSQPKLPVFFIGGHSGIGPETKNHPIVPKRNQYIILTASCGVFNYGEQKRIFEYLKTNAGLNNLRTGLAVNPAKFVKEELQNKQLNGEQSRYQVHYHGGPTLFDQKIDIVREQYNGFRLTPNQTAFSAAAMTPFPTRKQVALNRIEKVHGSERANIYKKNPNISLRSVWLSDFIGDEPGIYIITTCRGHANAGGIRGEYILEPKNTPSQQPKSLVGKAKSLFQPAPPFRWVVTTDKEGRYHRHTKEKKPYSKRTPMKSRRKQEVRSFIINGPSIKLLNPNNSMGSETEAGLRNVIEQRAQQGNAYGYLVKPGHRRQWKVLLSKNPTWRRMSNFLENYGVKAVKDLVSKKPSWRFMSKFLENYGIKLKPVKKPKEE